MTRNRLKLIELESRTTPAGFGTLLFEDHTDIRTDFVGGSWNVRPHQTVTDTFSPANDTLFYVPANAKAAQPSDSKFAFLGAGSGKDVWILPQTQQSGILFLGFSGEGTNPSDLGKYLETDSRVGATLQWITLDLVNATGPGQFSLYQIDSGGNPVVWMDTADGITAEDIAFLGAGGHIHYNWAFTAKGIYEIEMKASSYTGDNKTNPTSSGVFKLFFSVDPPGPVNTVPATQSATFAPPLSLSTIRIDGPFTAPKPLETRLTVSQGKLTFGDTTGISIVGGANGSSDVTIQGVRDAVNSALQTLNYTPITTDKATFTIATSDLGYYRPPSLAVQTDTDSFQIDIFGTPPPPTVPTVPGTPTVPVVPTVPGTSPGVVTPVSPPSAFPSFTTDHILVTSAGPGGGPHIRVVDATTGAEKFSFFAYDPKFTGGVRIAVADITGDGISDVIAAAGPGGGPHVQVFDGVTGRSVRSFFAYDPKFTGGIWVAAADINNDGRADIITGAGEGGGPHVQVFDGITGSVIRSFFAYDSALRGGVNVTAADTNADGIAEIITAAGVGGGPDVRIFSGLTGGMMRSFLAFDATERTGFVVTAADLDGDRRAEIIVGSMTGDSFVRVFEGSTGRVITRITPFPNGSAQGVRLGVVDFNGDKQPDILIAPGSGGRPTVQIFNGSRRGGVETTSPFIETAGPLTAFDAYSPEFLGGVFVAGS